ncbi:vasohibin-2 isoform X2 [Eurytemora carolleeae]|uniref:vasohibin-2 isoform X2 n=1 Tax=Eurytemora carolleeae TaxID=1294199 RepID=UPI000C793B0B|nr:vasohibin-2 isoform X2 [Eurytemora carolleeae]|eukprot:XP_023340823.1 vasohibin-2-like isoform X2 [Eurytemora affinis]
MTLSMRRSRAKISTLTQNKCWEVHGEEDEFRPRARSQSKDQNNYTSSRSLQRSKSWKRIPSPSSSSRAFTSSPTGREGFSHQLDSSYSSRSNVSLEKHNLRPVHPEPRAHTRLKPGVLHIPPLRPKPGAEVDQVLIYLEKMQQYITDLKYNHDDVPLKIQAQASMITHYNSAKRMIREGQPIKCMDAIILGIHLTTGIQGLGRFPINFKSEIHDKAFKPGRKYYYHVVLGLLYKGKFGAVGLSRKSTLMDKPLIYSSLFDLILEYQRSYTECKHTLLMVRVGDIISHLQFSVSPIPWRGLLVKTDNQDSFSREKVGKYGRYLKSLTKLQDVKPKEAWVGS